MRGKERERETRVSFRNLNIAYYIALSLSMSCFFPFLLAPAKGSARRITHKRPERSLRLPREIVFQEFITIAVLSRKFVIILRIQYKRKRSKVLKSNHDIYN